MAGWTRKAETVVEQENFCAFRDSGVVCAFSGSYIDDEGFEALFDADYEQLLAVGASVVERERHFNNKRGRDASEDRLPYEVPDLESSIREYYDLRGYNDDGTVPDDRVSSPSTPAPADD